MGAAKTVLIVDDSATMRSMVRFSLTEAGYSVVEAVDGQDGLDKLSQQPVRIVITDYNMPVMDGITFIKQIRSQAPYRHTPVLMLTTEGATSRKEEGRAAGATGWLVKPFDPAQLISLVNRLVP